MNTEKLVSIAMITYNHENYIHQAIQSVVNQKTDFDIELIIGDDASTDNTLKILNEYQMKYPNIIKIYNQQENVGPTKNFFFILNKCEGKYIAQLEGDDWWSDNYKLKKQIDFLEQNPDYIATSHSCITYLMESNDYVKYSHYYYETSHDYTLEDFKIIQSPGHTCSMVYRNFIKSKYDDFSIIYTADKNTCDRTINMILVLLGKIYCFSDCMSVYRRVVNIGAFNINSLYKGKNISEIECDYLLSLKKFSEEHYGIECINQKKLDDVTVNALKWFFKTFSKDDWRIYVNICKKRNVNLIIKIIDLIMRKVKNSIIKYNKSIIEKLKK